MKHDFTTRVLCLVLILLSLPIFAIAYDPVPDDILYIVNNPNPADRLNLRTRPSDSAPSLGRYYNGVRMGALSEPSNGWIKVYVEGTNESVAGYMQTRYLAYNPSTPVPSAIPLATVNNKNGTGLNLREKPSSASANLGLHPILNGATVLVLGWGSEWCHVREENLTGYVLTSGLVFPGTGSSNNSNSMNNASTTTSACVRNPNPADRLNLRAEPRTDAVSYGKYYNGTPVTVLSDNSNGWVKVRIGGSVGGAEGYMQKTYLAFGDDCAKVKPEFTLYQATSSGWELYNFPRVDQNAFRMFGVENVEVLGIMENWWHVRIREHTGYVPSNGLAIVNNPSSNDRLNLREKPQTGAVSLGNTITAWLLCCCPVFKTAGLRFKWVVFKDIWKASISP